MIKTRRQIPQPVYVSHDFFFFKLFTQSVLYDVEPHESF
jgi:hypothetical protein